MTRSPEITSYRIGGYSTRTIVQAGSAGHTYHAGYVVTPHGIVGVYMQDGLTNLIFAKDGREVRARWDRTFTERALITVCRRFAAEPNQGTEQ